MTDWLLASLELGQTIRVQMALDEFTCQKLITGASVGSWKDTRVGVCLPQPMTARRDLNPQGAKAPVLTSLLATSIMYP